MQGVGKLGFYVTLNTPLASAFLQAGFSGGRPGVSLRLRASAPTASPELSLPEGWGRGSGGGAGSGVTSPSYVAAEAHGGHVCRS